VQGVIRTFDPQTREGVLVRDDDHTDVALAIDALEGSIFRTLRQGQRVVFDFDDHGRAARVRTGAEVDMGLPTARV